MVVVFIWTVYTLYKLIAYNYKPSFSQKLTVATAIFLIVYFQQNRENLPWDYLKDSFFNIEYIQYVFISLSVVVYFFLVINFFQKLEYLFPTSRFNFNKGDNTYLSDDPVLDEKKDLLSYGPKIKSLTNILLNENFEKSIAIGLVGPWGNGKSSVIEMSQKQLKTIESYHDRVVIHFLPYLNHKEEDIINEFFIALSNQISKFNGKLSSQILDYAKKLTDVYKGGNAFNLFEKHVTTIDQSSAKELYDNINKRLKEIDKKIIVFVDDLDRLSGKEIIQILKLIRNTADFRNTIFVVAMDKDYVVKRLKAENNISSTRFIDKFFQLEIYLPEIDKNILRKFVYEKLNQSVLNSTSDFKSKLERGINHKDNLFEDYIKNLRDAKRLVNQIIFDYNFLREEINFKDFMNFTYFKLKFPKFMELLNHNRLDFLKLENGQYKLKEKPPKNDEKSEKKYVPTLDNIVLLGNTEYNDYSFLDKYAVSELLSQEEDCLKKLLGIDCDDALLLSKTLAYLFGDQNKKETFNSIKEAQNFKMLMQQRVFENVLTEREFNLVIHEGDIEKRHEILENLHTQNKFLQLLDRLDYYNTDKHLILSQITLVLFRLYEKRTDYNITDQQLLNRIAVYVERLIQDNDKVNQEQVNWMKADIFEGNLLSTENKLNILGELWEAKEDNNLWHLTEEYISKKTLELFKKYLSKHHNQLWSVTDFSFYKYYHLLKHIDGLKEALNKEIRTFWSKNNIELLCAQSTDTPAFSLSSFQISNTVSEIFGSIRKYHEFVKNHSKNPSRATKEFLELYELHAITGYVVPIVYNFKNSRLMLDKIKNKVEIPGRGSYDEDANITQLVFKTNSKELIEELIEIRKRQNANDNLLLSTTYKVNISTENFPSMRFASFSSGEFHYLFINHDKKFRLNFAIEILKALEAIASNMFTINNKNFRPWRRKIVDKELIKLTDEVTLQLISLQSAQSTQL
ncbi:P-loop NTPase fold protein [Winogradskyella sp. J14-2]|uniref:KAP family P-loop NTPase fold protein n=1 Tax=Winogradskyella sp. J14-2 TaxID=1936080 RepID=UPI0018DDB878|nr:P-loop NTPase fold protein [Winogradskyella sp. J14-2]